MEKTELGESAKVFLRVAEKVGTPTRRCRHRPLLPGEKPKTLNCTCNEHGRSHVVGCALSPGGNVCKYSRSKNIRHRCFGERNKALEHEKLGLEAEAEANKLADRVGEAMREEFPEHFSAMKRVDKRSRECRLGSASPFSAVSICSGFVAHSHRDTRDVPDGLSAVLTVIHDPQQDTQYHQFPCLSLQESDLRGLSVYLPSGSMAFESSRHILHQTSRIGHDPASPHPPRLALVFFLHENLDLPHHGANTGKISFFSRFLVIVRKLRDVYISL